MKQREEERGEGGKYYNQDLILFASVSLGNQLLVYMKMKLLAGKTPSPLADGACPSEEGDGIPWWSSG